MQIQKISENFPVNIFVSRCNLGNVEMTAGNHNNQSVSPEITNSKALNKHIG